MYCVKSIDIRMEEGLKSVLEDLATKRKLRIGETARELAWIGIGVFEEGGVTITGPFGIKRPFSKIDFGGIPTRLTIWLDDELIKTLKQKFKSDIRDAFRQALKLAVFVLDPNKASITGPFGISRPFASIKRTVFKNKKSQESFEKFSSK